MKYEIGQKVTTPLGEGIIVKIYGIIPVLTDHTHLVRFDIDNKHIYVIGFNESLLKPHKTPHERLLEVGFEMVLDDEHFTIFEHQELDYTIRVDKLWKGIGIHHYNDDPHYRYIYLELSRILTDYLEWLEEEK